MNIRHELQVCLLFLIHLELCLVLVQYTFFLGWNLSMSQYSKKESGVRAEVYRFHKSTLSLKLNQYPVIKNIATLR